MTQLTAAEQEIVRKRPQKTNLYLSIFEPQVIFRARIDSTSLSKGSRVIPYDTVSVGNYTIIPANATMWIGSTFGDNDVGKVRVRSATATEITVSENSDINWEGTNNYYLTVFYYIELWPIFPRIVQNNPNSENVTFYKDYDIEYTNQNSILGTFVNMGPHRAATLDPASGQTRIYWSSTGTYNVLENSLSYDWWFQGATVTGSSSANPGYRTYDTPGHYVTRLTVTDSSNGSTDTSYRYVSIYNRFNQPIQQWQLMSLSGSRDEGGYTASFRVFRDIPIQEHAIVVLYGDSWYGNTQRNIGGNYPGAEDIFWVGYVDKDSINYDYQHSEITFSAHSITGMMKESSGFSVSVESKASPSKWYELLDMDGRRAIYHYLRWHTTALQIADFQFVGDDYKIQFFDADRESMYDAIDNYMRDTLWGKVVSDRQGKVWMEVNAEGYEVPSDSFPTVMDITNRDWMNEPSIEEALSEELAFIEMGGIAYSGTVTGTFSALLASAPGNAPGFHGSIETHEGLALLGQEQLNWLVGNVFANANSPFPSISMDMAINASNLDIAPQEGVGLSILAEDTIRDLAIDGLYIPSNMSWTYSSQDSILLPQIEFKQVIDGDGGETTVVEVPTNVGPGFNNPGLVIPPIPPLTVPAYAIPTGTISAIINSALQSLVQPYAVVGWFNNNFVSTTSGGIVVATATRAAGSGEVEVSSCPAGTYWVSAVARCVGTGLGGGTIARGQLDIGFNGGAEVTVEVWGEANGSGGLTVSGMVGRLLDITPNLVVGCYLGGGLGAMNTPTQLALSLFKVSA